MSFSNQLKLFETFKNPDLIFYDKASEEGYIEYIASVEVDCSNIPS